MSEQIKWDEEIAWDKPSKESSKEQPTQSAPSMLEQMFGLGSPTARVIKGAVVDPLLGINQLLSRLPGLSALSKEGADALVKQYEQATAKARERVGSTGFDFFELGGAIVSPANKIAQAQRAATSLGRVGQGVGQGTIAGLLSPTATATTEDEFVTNKLLQAGFGSILGGAVPVAGAGLNTIYKTITSLPITEAAKQRALQKYVYDMIPEGKREEIISSLRKDVEVVPGSRPTAAQTLAETPAGAQLIKEQQRVAGGAGASKFLERSKEQQQARIQSLKEAFGDDAALADLIAKRQEVTKPLREQALQDANVYGQKILPLEQEAAGRQASLVYALQGQGKTATEAAQALERANTWTPVPGLPRFPGRYSPNMERSVEYKNTAYDFGNVVDVRKAEVDFIKAQVQQLKDQGYYPLDSGNIITRLEKVLTTPGERSNDLLVNASQTLVDKLKRLTDENGVINSVDLYNVRKDIAQDIAGFLTQKNMPFGAEAAKVDKSLKNILDSAINKASGSDLWSQYLKEFATYSKKIDQAETGKLLRTKLGEGSLGDVEKAGVFSQAVQNAATTLKTATGTQRYQQLSDLLTQDQNKAVNLVLADLSRAKKAAELGKVVGQSKGPLADAAESIPSFLDNKVTLLRTVIRTIKTGSQKELDSQITNLMLNPQDLALFIEAIPKQQIKTIGEAVMKRLSPSVATQFSALMDTTNITRGVIQNISGEF